MKEIILFMVLVVSSYIDVKKKQVPIVFLAILSIVYIVLIVVQSAGNGMQILLSLMPGGFMLYLAKVSKEAIGYGDGFMIMFIGVFIGVSRTIRVLILGSVLCLLVSVVLLFLKGIAKKRELPFVPFLFLGYVGELLI